MASLSYLQQSRGAIPENYQGKVKPASILSRIPRLSFFALLRLPR